METIKSKNGIVYREMLWINGKATKSPCFSRKTDARQWKVNQYNSKRDIELYGDSLKLKESMSIEQFSKIWMKTKEAQGLSTITLVNYESYFRNHILPFFSGQDIKKIQKNQIESFQVMIRKSHNAKGTNMILIVLKAMFKEAIREGYLIKNPAEYIKKHTEDNTHDVFWTRSEIEQFQRGSYEHEFYDLFLVAMNTGMRKGELTGLCWDRVCFSQNTITVTRTRNRKELKERTKTNLKRVVPMNEITRATLLNLFYKRSPSPHVFVKQDGTPINHHHIYRKFGIAQKKAGIENRITFHDLRHTFASQFIMNGGNIYDLQKILGHTNINQTTRYAHFSMDHLHNAIKNFSLGEGKNESNQILTMKSKFAEKVS